MHHDQHVLGGSLEKVDGDDEGVDPVGLVVGRFEVPLDDFDGVEVGRGERAHDRYVAVVLLADLVVEERVLRAGRPHDDQSYFVLALGEQLERRRKKKMRGMRMLEIFHVKRWKNGYKKD
jgi:hypothetical protein